MTQNFSVSVILSTIFLVLAFPATTSSDPDPLQDFCVPATKQIGRFSTCKNSSDTTVDDFVFSGIKSPGKFGDTGFSGVSVNATVFPGLNTLGMSFARADLKVGGVNSPHLHPRATEVAFVLEGTVYSGFVDSGNRVFARIIGKGNVMVFPKGLLHFQMNVGESPATILASFNSQNPGLVRIPESIFGSGIKGDVLEKAFGLSAKEVGLLERKFRSRRG